MNGTKSANKELGYDEFFESGRNTLGLNSYPVARVTSEYREAYRIIDPEGVEYFARITGKHMYTAERREDYPAVGDWVAFEPVPDGKAVIRGILPRKTILQRKFGNGSTRSIVATNIDTAFIVESMDRDFNLNRFERYLIVVTESNISPVLVLNKSDLPTPEVLNDRIHSVQERFGDIPVVTTSATTPQGIAPLAGLIMPGNTYCFLGSSGVGKSSLINRLLGTDEIRVREISLSIERGRHTTTSREMYFPENGGTVIDNPGTREVGIGDSAAGMATVFDDIQALSSGCRFKDCTHTHEPGCAVLDKLENNTLDRGKYDNYVKLKNEADFYALTEKEKRDKDRKFGKFLKKAKEQVK